MKYRLSAIALCALLFASCSNHKPIPASAKDFCSQIHFSDSTNLSNELKDLEDSMKNKTGALVLEDGGNAMMARAWLTENAEKTIDIQLRGV